MKAEAIAKKIKLVCLDVDGVLTDGSIIISGQGELFKQFYVCLLYTSDAADE